MPLHRADLPPLELLRTFEAAARNLSFTRAGAELFLTQSAVSRQIRALEEAVKAPLFERRHRAIVLTEAGQLLYRTTLDVMDRLRDATQRLRRAGERRSLTVTTTVGFAALWLVPRLPRFTAAHPGVDVRISATNRRVDLAREDVDVAVRFLPADPAHGPALFGETVMPVCSPALLGDASRPLRTPADLRRHVLLLTMDPDAGTHWGEWTEWLDAMGLSGLEPAGRLHFSQYDLLVNAAAAGQGVAIGRMPLLRQSIAEGRLVSPFGLGTVSPRAYYLIESPRTGGDALVAAFVRWLREEATADVPSPDEARASAPRISRAGRPRTAPAPTATPRSRPSTPTARRARR